MKLLLTIEDGSTHFKCFGAWALAAVSIASISGSPALSKQDYRKAELNQEAWPLPSQPLLPFIDENHLKT